MSFLITSLHFLIITEISRKGNFLISLSQTHNTKIFSLNPKLLILSYSNDPSELLSLTFKCLGNNSKSENILEKIKISQTFDSFIENGKRYQKTYKFEINKEDSELVLEFTYSNPHKYFKNGTNKTNFQTEDSLIKNRKVNLKFKDISIIGHRGSGSNNYSDEYLENSMPSFKAALKRGADFVECDVQLTKDDIPVIIHNNEINEIDIGDYKAKEFVNLGLSTPYKVKLPTFKKLLKKLPQESQLDVEIKVKWNAFYNRNHFVNRVLDVVYEYNNHKLFFCTFDPIMAAITALKQKNYNSFFLIHDPSSEFVNYYSPLFKYSGVKGFILNSLRLVEHPKETKEIISNGFMVMSWGDFNLQKDTLAQQIELGVRGFITDDVVHTYNHLNDILY